jgi:hypothetical protein
VRALDRAARCANPAPHPVLAKNTGVASIALLTALRLTRPYGLTGVWLSFGAFNAVRLAGVLRHHFVTGPLARKKKVA